MSSTTISIAKVRTSRPPVGALTRWAAPIGLLGIGAMLRVHALFNTRFDSDEPQHMHVAWGWAHGLVQYRDLFDNHAPLFHLLFAPLVRWFGQTPDILILGRLMMLPLYAAALVLTYRIGTILFDRRSGMWAAAVIAVWPPFFNTSLEFRADDLWMVMWLATVLILIGGRWSRRRAYFAGLLLGTTLAVSMKTILLAFALGLAAGVVWLFARHTSRIRLSPTATTLRTIPPLVAGTLLVPTALIAVFAIAGGLRAMAYCVLLHNSDPGLYHGIRSALRVALFVPAATVIACAAWFCYGRDTASDAGDSRLLVACSAAFASVAFQTIWPLADWQDRLPIDPLLAIVLVPMIWRIAPSRGTFLLCLLTLGELVFLTVRAPRHDQTLPERRRIAHVLALTGPDEFVMDLKGETIYRARPFFYALETVTRRRLQRGEIVDDIPDRLIATATHVVVPDSPRFPPRGRRFMASHYLLVGNTSLPRPFAADGGMLRVAGQWLGDLAPDQSVRFDVTIPGPYTIICATGAASGRLDGTPLSRPRLLGAGRHEWIAQRSQHAVAFIWAPAVDQGFTPYPSRGL